MRYNTSLAYFIFAQQLYQMRQRVKSTSGFESPDLLIVFAFEVQSQAWSRFVDRRRCRDQSVKSATGKKRGSMDIALDRSMGFSYRLGLERHAVLVISHYAVDNDRTSRSRSSCEWSESDSCHSHVFGLEPALGFLPFRLDSKLYIHYNGYLSRNVDLHVPRAHRRCSVSHASTRQFDSGRGANVSLASVESRTSALSFLLLCYWRTSLSLGLRLTPSERDVGEPVRYFA